MQNTWYQSVILDENDKSRGALEGGRAGLPLFKPMGSILTHTITGIKGGALRTNLDHATINDVEDMNAFISKMSEYYQFLPNYDFRELAIGGSYFNGLTLGDFLLLRDEQQNIRGLVGLWNQKAFKQTLSLIHISEPTRPY